MKAVTVFVNSLNLSSTPQQLECLITTDTDINTTDLESIVKATWYRDNGIKTVQVSNSEGGLSIIPTVVKSNVTFMSTLNFSAVTLQTPSTTLGNYTCVAWIGEESNRKRTSNNVEVIMKSK